ncbi:MULTISPECIES: hypothetical protein [unclassified Pseudomonas]|uniref:hypothetical protein n=1 Tax=unclassified Pseudomonas TaxID=196821 RepID=UPI000A1E8228|nr:MULTISPECIES: hypothetical protein [unclassified Pseudomonas]MDI2144533.1 hypothetical protein [Pseudomonas sp. ITA]
MIFSIDITEAFGAVDFDNAGGIKSYIRILPTENFLDSFRLNLSNFVLNLIDEPITSSLNRQDPAFLKNMTEDGFLIIRNATINFESIKGYEKLLRLPNQEQGYLIHERLGHELNIGDKVYDIGGRSCSTPEILINLSIISPKKIKLEFNPSDHKYIENYSKLQDSLEKLNSQEKPIQPPLSGLFDATFSNIHTTSNFEAGYRTYNK